MLNDLLNINWEEFHFLRPMFLWLLLPAFVALIIGLIGIQEEVKWKKVIAPHLRAYIIQKGSESIKKRMQVLLFVFLSIAILGLAGPTWNTVEVPGKTLETPVVLLLDLSQSMMATDIQPNRLERAKFKINDLLDANPRARVALVGFAGTAHTIVPLTSDYQIIKSHLEGLSPQIMPFAGTNHEAAFNLSDTIISVSSAPATIVLFTDDFDENTFLVIQNFISGRENKLEIFPVNTISGAEVPMPGGNNPMKDKTGKVVRSALNSEVLDKLNSIEKITVHQLTLDKSDVEHLSKKISDNLKFKEQDQEKEDDWQDRGLLLVIPFFLFVLMWFRRGWVIYSLAILLTLSSCKSENKFADLWFTKDYQAQKLYDKGDFGEAAKLFTDPLHKGTSFFKAGNYEQAIKYFAEDTTAMGAYNLGLAYFKNGDFAAAEIAFGKAVEMNPELQDAKTNQLRTQQIMHGINSANPEDAEEFKPEEVAENIENKDTEDLGGGGQEATKEDMQKERKEETVNTDVRKGKELDEVPDDFESGKRDNSQKVLMRKVDDDPALFLKRKFVHQVKTKNIQPKTDRNEW
jgi:Ca-activated chloride channel family protein